MKTSPTGIPLKRRSRILPWAMAALWIFQLASHLGARGQVAPAIQDAQKTPAAKTEVLEVKFKQPPAADSEASRTLQSLVKLRDIGEQYATGGLYFLPPRGYASVSVTRAIDMGFPLNVDLKDFVSSPLGSKLLLAPFFAFDGMNEHGLYVAVAQGGTTLSVIYSPTAKELHFSVYQSWNKIYHLGNPFVRPEK